MNYASLSTQMSLTAGIVGVISWIIMAIPMWKIIEKAGEPGWKGIIPVYGEYILYKISWNTMMFWVSLVLAVFISVTVGMTNSFSTVLSVIATTALTVIQIIALVKLARAFGKGGGFAVGLIFLNVIFMYILAFGSAEYKGNQ